MVGNVGDDRAAGGEDRSRASRRDRRHRSRRGRCGAASSAPTDSRSAARQRRLAERGIDLVAGAQTDAVGAASRVGDAVRDRRRRESGDGSTRFENRRSTDTRGRGERQPVRCVRRRSARGPVEARVGVESACRASASEATGRSSVRTLDRRRPRAAGSSRGCRTACGDEQHVVRVAPVGGSPREAQLASRGSRRLPAGDASVELAAAGSSPRRREPARAPASRSSRRAGAAASATLMAPPNDERTRARRRRAEPVGAGHASSARTTHDRAATAG